MDVLIVETLEPLVMDWLVQRHALRYAPEVARDPRALRQALYNVRALVMASTSGKLDFAQLKNPEVDEWSKRSPSMLADLQKRGIHSAGGERLYREQPALAQLYAQISELAPSSFRDEVRQNIRHSRTLAPTILKGLPMPVLFITGDEDWVFPPAAGPAFAKFAPKGSAVRVPAAGHSVYFERAAQFNELIGRIV
jgi:pimeloyl-ACP methyl ester carboxylesterase